MTVTLEPVFFNGMYGGVYNYSFHVSDNGGGESDTEMRVAVPGASGMLSSDLWFGTANLGAVFTGDDASSIKIRYREKGTGRSCHDRRDNAAGTGASHRRSERKTSGSQKCRNKNSTCSEGKCSRRRRTFF